MLMADTPLDPNVITDFGDRLSYAGYLQLRRSSKSVTTFGSSGVSAMGMV